MTRFSVVIFILFLAAFQSQASLCKWVVDGALRWKERKTINQEIRNLESERNTLLTIRFKHDNLMTERVELSQLFFSAGLVKDSYVGNYPQLRSFLSLVGPYVNGDQFVQLVRILGYDISHIGPTNRYHADYMAEAIVTRIKIITSHSRFIRLSDENKIELAEYFAAKAKYFDPQSRPSFLEASSSPNWSSPFIAVDKINEHIKNVDLRINELRSIGITQAK